MYFERRLLLQQPMYCQHSTARNHTDPFGCPISAAPAVPEHVVKLHDRRHFKIHTEIGREHRPVSGQLFNVAVRILPDSLKTVIVQKEVNHTVKMILVLQVGLINTNQ